MPSDVRYLLRVRQERAESFSVSLRALSDGELRIFGDLDEMVAFLKGQAVQEPADSKPRSQ